MNAHADTAAYESWMQARGPVVTEDLVAKHLAMREDLFPFLRATFYRWCRLWPEACPSLTVAPAVLAVGDLHVENFGTWRDAEGRLVWGINDLDEAQDMPYTLDLVRLAASALIALDDRSLSSEEVADAILEGYRIGLESGGRPFVLEADHGWLRDLALGELRDPTRFWAKLNGLEETEPGTEIRSLLMGHLPSGAQVRRISLRVAGLGSLGRQRFVAVAVSGGAAVAREAKALYPSAWSWVRGEADAAIRGGDLAASAVRSPDPFLSFALSDGGRRGWVVRRLAPHCCRVELSALTHRRDDRKLLRAMGQETANLHLGSGGAARAVLADLDRRLPDWLRAGAETMVKITREDWRAWRG